MVRSSRFLWLMVWLSLTIASQAASARILKVLPHYLDDEGRHSLSPSLYERDAYQAFLRANPDKRSALRFDINWKARGAGSERLTLRLELRSSGREATEPLVIERPVKAGRFFGTWSSLHLEGETYRGFGQLIAWRATLWRQDELLAEQKSFLW
ncbi:MAG: hypothetical protein U1G07_05360 [Verrucomicrobiota bacterium]